MTSVGGAELCLLLSDPRLDHVGLPEELKHGPVLLQTYFACLRVVGQLLNHLFAYFETLVDASAVVIVRLDERLALLDDVHEAFFVNVKVSFKSVMLLDETLSGCECVAAFAARNQMLFLVDP